MKKLIILILIIVSKISTVNGQCISNYSYTGVATDTVDFTNLSVASNAHYYWNFGDGSGSNVINPIHVYPDNGEYLVTLYVLDTISNCSNFYQNWITVVKPDTITCDVFFTDTIQLAGQNNDGLIITNQSSNCG